MSNKYWTNKTDNKDIISATDFNNAFDNIAQDITNALTETAALSDKIDTVKSETEQEISGKADKTAVSDLELNKIKPLENNVSQLSSDLVELENDSYVLYEKPHTTTLGGWKITSTGGYSKVTGFNTYAFPVEQGNVLKVKSNVSFQFQDIADRQGFAKKGNTHETFNGYISVPIGANYIMISCATDDTDWHVYYTTSRNAQEEKECSKVYDRISEYNENVHLVKNLANDIVVGYYPQMIDLLNTDKKYVRFLNSPSYSYFKIDEIIGGKEYRWTRQEAVNFSFWAYEIDGNYYVIRKTVNGCKDIAPNNATCLFLVHNNGSWSESTDMVVMQTTDDISDYSVIEYPYQKVVEVKIDRLKPYVEKLPSYYSNEWLDDRLKKVQTSASVLKGVSFAFITDLHLNANAKNSRIMLKSILDKTSIPYVICGGDYSVMFGGQKVLDKELKDLNDYISTIGKDKWFSVRGNHDFYNYVSNEDRTVSSLSFREAYEYLFRNVENIVTNLFVEHGCYCIDNNAQKTRILMLNTQDSTTDPSSNRCDNNFSNEQLLWVKNRINELNGYNFIVISHVASDSAMPDYDSKFVELQSVLEAFKNKNSYISDNITVDFSDNTNELICHINGHAHIDQSNVSNNLLSISTTCDACYRDDGLNAIIGTITEQAFDVFSFDFINRTIKTTRFGRGNDREWSY